MPKGRLVFDGDNIYTEKDARIYKLKSSVSSKIDAIPGVVDSLDSISATDALSANMGRQLQDQINSLSGTGKFLSTWDCTTGLPGTNPQEDPYTYKVGDYYVVSATGSTNYKPHGGTYTQGVPSTTVELENVGVNDKYYFDGADWVRIPDTAIQIGIDTALSTTSTNAVENRAIANAINTKQNIISDLNDIRSGATAGATALQALDNISELTNNIGYQTAGDVSSAISTALTNYVTKTYVDNAIDGVIHSGSTAPSNPQEGDLWYDTTNDVLKVYDGTNWNIVGDDAAKINVKTFPLSGSTGATAIAEAQTIWDWIDNGNTALINYSNNIYHQCGVSTTGNNNYVTFSRETTIDDVLLPATENSTLKQPLLGINVISGTVDSIDVYTDEMTVLSTDIDYSVPYMPVYDGSPATKKYVDDSISALIPEGSTAPANPSEGDLRYDTVNHVLKIYNGTSWETVDTDTDTRYTAGSGINISAQNVISADTSVVATQTDLATKQDTLVSGTNIKTINNQSLLGSEDITINGILSGPLVPAASAQYAGKIFYCTFDNTFYKCDGTQWTEIGSGGTPTGAITNNTTGTTSTISQEWVGTRAEFEALSSYGNIIYNIIE